jgi:hypothetical protein
MLVLFDSCYMFRSTHATIFRQFQYIRLVLLNCTNTNPCQCYSSQSHKCNRLQLPEDGPIFGPKQVATTKQNQREQFDWFIFIYCLDGQIPPIMIHSTKQTMNIFPFDHDDLWRTGSIHPCFLDLDTGRRWVVSFGPRPLYTWEKSCRYPLDRRLDGPQDRSGWRGEEKILDHTGIWTPTSRSSSPLASYYTESSRLLHVILISNLKY